MSFLLTPDALGWALVMPLLLIPITYLLELFSVESGSGDKAVRVLNIALWTGWGLFLGLVLWVRDFWIIDVLAVVAIAVGLVMAYVPASRE